MAASRELTALLSSGDTLSALDHHLQRAIQRILRELATGISRPGSSRATELMQRIKDIASSLDPTRDSFMRDWIRKHVPEAYLLGDQATVRQIGEQLRSASPEVRSDFGSVNRAFTPINSTSMRAIAGAFSDKMQDIHRQVVTVAGITVRRTHLVFHQDAAIRDTVIGGIIRGSTGRELSDDIARMIIDGQAGPDALKRLREHGFQNDLTDLYQRLSKGEFITAGSRKFSVRAYANLTARTMLREAHKVATVVRLQQNGIDHVRISKHIQDKPDVCTAFAGRVFYVGSLPEDPLGFPSLKSTTNGGPPYHPNCAHVAEPFVAALKGQGAVESARKDAGLLPQRFFGKTAAEVTELVEALDEAAMRDINLQGRDAA